MAWVCWRRGLAEGMLRCRAGTVIVPRRGCGCPSPGSSRST